MMNVHRIVNEILQSCSYILTDNNSNQAYIVDCGDAQPIIDYLKKYKKTLVGIFLTHSHYDHIYGLDTIIKLYPETKIFASEDTFKGIADEDLCLAYLYVDEYQLQIDEKNKRVVSPNSELEILGQTACCISTPGHDIDCMTFMIGNNIFTGDSYNPSVEVFVKWERSNVEDAERSETLIRKLISERKLTVFPGHLID